MNTDEEQVEQLKTWLKQNGLSIVLGIVIGVGGLSGYRYWIHLQETAAEEASAHYSQMLTALSAKEYAEVQTRARLLIDEYAKTEYALLARLALAKSHVERDEFDPAQEFLQQVVDAGAQQPLGYLARTRLAALQLQTDRLDSALATLAIDFPEEFAARAAELRGDIYARQGRVGDAIEAYRAAQQASPGPADLEFLQRKMDDLGNRS